MNFVDVQPMSFLDYAWTTPSSAATETAKPLKSSRKQNRCCDQCRKGKRACDAAILEDTLLDTTGAGGDHPTVFHYSDVFGPLAPCHNCVKTKKACTFEWLRSQRVLQASPQANTTPPPKRRRKNNCPTTFQTPNEAQQSETSVDSRSNNPFAYEEKDSFRAGPAELGMTFADFPTGMPAFDLEEASVWLPFGSEAITYDCGEGLGYLYDVPEEEDALPLCREDSGMGSSLKTISEGRTESPESDDPLSQCLTTASDHDTNPNAAIVRTPRKKRRRGPSNASSSTRMLTASPCSMNKFLTSANQALLTDNLLKIYHDSFENALSCWLTERTCPYSNSEVSLASDAAPDWNRIYHHVFRLDLIAAPIRGRALTYRENKAASRALNLAIFAFAAQWAQSGQRSNSKYPYCRDGIEVFSGNAQDSSLAEDFDRTLQVSAWEEAKMALQDAVGIESFRLALAQIVFSMAQRPRHQEKDDPTRGCDVTENSPVSSPCLSEEEGVDECEDLLSKLSLTIDSEGPPVNLEQGLRLIHSLRSRVTMSGATRRTIPSCAKQLKPVADRLNADDKATIDLLFWLGVMFDTLSSAMHKRPLVVSDEDSDIFKTKSGHNERCDEDAASFEAPNNTLRKPEGLWDEYLFAHQHKRITGTPLRWPCSYEQAASLLCDAAPVKVLLFRKVTRIQTLLSRNVRGDKIEKAIKVALDVYTHWMMLYAPFVQDCIEYHDSLPPRIQSWYICLTGHWHLATLLLADLIEIIDSPECGVQSTMSQQRVAANFLARFREKNCRELSEIAYCACPREDASFSKSPDFHFAVNKGALMTEPWTAVMIRAFAKAGVVLLESASSPASGTPDRVYQEDAFRRADACVKALWQLGRKSDMALAAARILGDAVKQRRSSIEDQLSDMGSFLEAGIWENFGEVSGAFEGECI